jgi:transforming growth factor-beta-induced protein
MFRNKLWIPLTTAAALSVAAVAPGLSSASKKPHEKTPSHEKAAGDIVDTAIAAGSFQTLVAAVQAAGLAETLKGEGPFTVFAPTDEAFAKLPEGTVEDLLEEENRPKLQAILTYHVVPGKVLAADVVKMKKAKTVEGQELTIQVYEGKVRVDGAQVVKADIETSNGVIHVIDSVVLPDLD